jgi:hypothetical protein
MSLVLGREPPGHDPLLLSSRADQSRPDFKLLLNLLAIIAVLNHPITEDEHSLRHVAKLRIVPVNAFNHDRTGHAIEILASAFLVRVRVIPIQPGRRIEWNVNSIVQHFSWHRHHCQDITLRILGRNVQAVKMQIAYVLAERERTFLV